MIFSNKGKPIVHTGNEYFTEDGVIRKSGGMQFGPGGSTAVDAGDMIFGTRGTVSVSGNTLFTDKGVYTLSGGMLFGPGGRSWSGVSSMEEAKVIVASEM